MSVTTTLLLLLFGAQETPPETAAVQDPVAALEAVVEQGMVDWEVPGLALTVVKDGKVLLAKGYGVRELGQEGVVGADTLFAIGSTTKAMIAASLGMLVDEGKVGWDDPVTKHLPGFQVSDPWVTREMTVRDLLTHRGGLGNADYLWYRHELPTSEVLERLREIPPAYSFRGGFVYQNLMYVTAGAVVEAVDGRTWSRFLTERLFEPLGMTHTVPTGSVAAMREDVARPHDKIGDEVQVIDLASVDHVGAAGAVWSSASDLSLWIQALLAEDPGVLKAATRDTMMSPQVVIPKATFYPTTRFTEPSWTTYGLGWFQQDYNGRFLCYHTGSIDGMSALVGLVPSEGLGFAVLINKDHAELRHALWYTTIDLFTGVSDGRDWSADLREFYDGQAEEQAAALRRRAESREKDTRPSHDLPAYQGTYADALYGTVTVTCADDVLTLTRGEMTGTLSHHHHDTFQITWQRPWITPSLVTFRVDVGGRLGSLELAGRTFRRR